MTETSWAARVKAPPGPSTSSWTSWPDCWLPTAWLPAVSGKHTFAKPAPVERRLEIATSCEVVIEAFAERGSCTSCSAHDIGALEGRGLVGIFLASSEFRVAADVQARAAGFPVSYVLVPHPIQDRTDDELRELARMAYPQVLSGITRRA